VDEPCRILFHIPLLAVGGAEVNLLDLAQGVPRDRFSPVVWCSEKDGPIGDALRASGIPVHVRALDPAGAADWLASEIRPHIFHSFSYRRDDRDTTAASLAGVPVIVTSRHNMRPWDTDNRVQPWETARNDVTTMIVANSYRVAEHCLTVEQAPPEKIRVIQNGVRIPEPAFTNETASEMLVIGSVGNLRKVKGYEVLLKAAAIAARRSGKFHVVICGADYGELAGLRRLRAELGLDERVTFAGSRLDLDPIYAALDLYVQSSHSEGMPTAILEAMARGLPVVTTSAGGCAEAVIDGETGYVTEPGDADALGAAMMRLMEDCALRLNMGAAGRRRAIAHFSVDRVIREFCELYSSLHALPRV
jgi:glycosyltransferase involved in cell wall biosynthesis